MTVASALGRLSRALAAWDVPAPAAPASAEQASEIERAVAPLELPADAAEFHRLVDPDSVAVLPEVPFGGMTSPVWHWNAAAGHPRVLFPLGYESHMYCSVELGSPGHPGGAVFRWDNDSDGSYLLVAASLTAMIDEMAAMVERGEGERIEAPDPAFRLDEQAWHHNCDRQLREQPHPEYGSAAAFPIGAPAAWPPHWRNAPLPPPATQHP